MDFKELCVKSFIYYYIYRIETAEELIIFGFMLFFVWNFAISK